MKSVKYAFLGIAGGAIFALARPSDVTQPMDSSVSPQQVCLAALISEFLWSENPTGGESPMGRHFRTTEGIHSFVSRGGQTDCRVDGDKIIWRVPEGRWRDRPGWDTYLTYKLTTDGVTIISQWSRGPGKSDHYSQTLLAKYAP